MTSSDAFSCNPHTHVENIHRSTNSLAYALVPHGRLNPGLPLFHRGLQLSNWLMEAVAESSFNF